LKNVFARGTPGHPKLHPKMPRHSGWEPLLLGKVTYCVKGTVYLCK